ncbi:MAG: DctP family TRAP transporter solute-binding subunit [Desulfotalea sp.]
MRHTSLVISRMMILVMTFVVIQGSALKVCAAQFDNGPTVIRFSHSVAESTPKGQMALKFKELAEKALPGRVIVEVHPNSELFSDGDVLEALFLDDVQMCAPAFSKFSNYTKKLKLFDLPFFFNDLAAVERFQQSKTGQELLSSISSRGLFGLGYMGSEFKQLSANRPLIKPGDAEGLKFRIMNSDVLSAQFKAVGAIPVKKPFSQVYPLLADGVLDGQENTWPNMFSKNIYTVQSDITESNHGVLGYLVVTSVNFWESIDESERNILKSSLDEAIAFGNAEAIKISRKSKKAISGSTTIHELSSIELKKWRKVMKPIWVQFENEIGKKLIDKAYSANYKNIL